MADIEYVTSEELELTRKASEIKQWAFEKIENIGLTRGGVTAIRLHQGKSIKRLLEEAAPIGIFCEKYFIDDSDKVFIKHCTGDHPYDAIINDERNIKSALNYLEVTQARDGIGEYFRMLKLDQCGSVNALGKVTKTGSKKNGIKVEVENEAFSHDHILNKELQKIYDAAKRKCNKDYPKNTGLIIICDDSHLLNDESDTEKIDDYVTKEVVPMLKNFSMVFVVGWGSRVYFQYQCNLVL